jgi:DNA-binding CsgD family transcriptional regulator
MSERTAENHVQHIFLKLGLRNRAELVRWYTRGPEMSTESE